MDKYILGHYKYKNCEEMGNKLNLTREQVYKRCYFLAQDGLLDRSFVKMSFRHNFESKNEDRVVKLMDNHTYEEMADILNISKNKVARSISTLRKCGIIPYNEKKKYTKNGSYKTRAKLTKEELEIIEAKIDKENEEECIQAKKRNKEYLKQFKKKVGDTVEVVIATTQHKEKVEVKIIEEHERFYLAESETGFKTCIAKNY